MILAALLVSAELIMAVQGPVPPLALWAVVAFSGAATVLTYSILPTLFPQALSGRVNGVMNVMHFGTAFALQNLVGNFVSQWPRDAHGHYPAEAFGSAFATIAALQVAALLWFWRPWRWLARSPSLGRRRLLGRTPVRTANERARVASGRLGALLLGWRPASVAAMALLGLVAYNFTAFERWTSAVVVAQSRLWVVVASLSVGSEAPQQPSIASAAKPPTEQGADLRLLVERLQGRIALYEGELATLRPQVIDLARQLKGFQDVAARAQVAAPQASVATQVVAAVPNASARPTPRTALEQRGAATAARVMAAQSGANPATAAPAACERMAHATSPPLVLQFGRYQEALRLEHQAVLDEIIATVVACPNILLDITGFSDGRGTAKLKATLAQRRAQLTANYLEALGVKGAQVRVAGAADSNPVAPNSTDEGRARNRRVEVRVSSR